jgi:hypothetical protein
LTNLSISIGREYKKKKRHKTEAAIRIYYTTKNLRMHLRFKKSMPVRWNEPASLDIPKPAINPSHLDQIVVTPPFLYLTVCEHDDRIEIHDRGQPVGDDDYRLAFDQIEQRIMNQRFGF